VPFTWLVAKVHMVDKTYSGKIVQSTICSGRVYLAHLGDGQGEDFCRCQEAFVVGCEHLADGSSWQSESKACRTDPLVECLLNEFGHGATLGRAFLQIRYCGELQVK
jgi:hypothetical protein